MKVIHLIPSDGLGGVEHAARSLKPDVNLDIEVAFICGETLTDKLHIKTIDKNSKLNSLRFYKSGFKHLLNQKPDLLICSLWRTSIIGTVYFILMKILRKKEFKLVVFIHSVRFSHFFDKIITKFAIFFASEIWCDSYASKVAFSSNKYSLGKIKVISFFVRVDKKFINKRFNKNNNFVFWGRIAKAKRLDRAIVFFEKIHKKIPESLFFIYGPDCGELEALKVLVENLNLSQSVLFMGDKKPNHYPEEALNSKFFINTSSHEGMAIAVTEAMQLGLVPIVTPVGEIANYCIDGINSIYYNDSAYSNIIRSINNESVYDELNSNAAEYWDHKVDYSTDFNHNCLRLISKT